MADEATQDQDRDAITRSRIAALIGSGGGPSPKVSAAPKPGIDSAAERETKREAPPAAEAAKPESKPGPAQIVQRPQLMMRFLVPLTHGIAMHEVGDIVPLPEDLAHAWEAHHFVEYVNKADMVRALKGETT